MERVYGFIMFDHMCDELRLRNRFSTENAFKIFSTQYDADKNNHLINDAKLKIKLVNKIILTEYFKFNYVYNGFVVYSFRINTYSPT